MAKVINKKYKNLYTHVNEINTCLQPNKVKRPLEVQEALCQIHIYVVLKKKDSLIILLNVFLLIVVHSITHYYKYALVSWSCTNYLLVSIALVLTPTLKPTLMPDISHREAFSAAAKNVRHHSGFLNYNILNKLAITNKNT